MNVLGQYQESQEQYDILVKALQKKSNRLSMIRFVVAILLFLSIYLVFDQQFNPLWVFGFAILFVAFIFVIKYHTKVRDKKQFIQELLQINNDEINFIQHEQTPFKTGIEFQIPKHIYSYDLDIFGEKSLFQHLNRTATYLGEKNLAHFLNQKKNNQEILENQEAIDELRGKFHFRQNQLAAARLSKDNKNKYQYLKSWLETEENRFSAFFRILIYLLPLSFLLVVLLYTITKDMLFLHLIYQVFLINLFVGFSQYKKLMRTLSYTSKIEEITKSYATIIAGVEAENFESKKLSQLKEKLEQNHVKSSLLISQLAKSFSKLGSIQNPFASFFLNGTVLYHLHVYMKLQNWKREHAQTIQESITIIGIFECLSSFANFAYNNPNYVFPTINQEKKISFDDMGHPLLSKKSRVVNTIDFSNRRFTILTGSNMSGKSTFLRSIGVNMILANCGSVVCAHKAHVHPMPLLVSMRLADSLEDNESYFFAEIKKLRLIIEQLEHQTSFVLLDEILRGTNSDDKREGTIAVVKQMIDKKAIGVVATHDLEVCETTHMFPEVLSNKCFEAEIEGENLKFDFTIREGICKNKSASFLMKKMKVI